MTRNPAEIKLLEIKDLWCQECILASIAVWLNRNYELMFHDLWNFNYNREGRTLLGDRLRFSTCNVKKNIEKYNGIAVRDYKNLTGSDIADAVREQLNKSMPCKAILTYNTVPWAPDDIRHTYVGPVLIIGETDDKNGFIVRDPHLDPQLKRPVYLPWEVLKNEFISLETYSVVHDDYKIDDVKSFVMDIADQAETNNIIEKMNDFADDIKYIDFKLETENCNGPQKVKLIFYIETIARCRTIFTLLIKYLYRIDNSVYLSELANRFINAAGMWHVIKVSLVKNYYRNSFSAKDANSLFVRTKNVIDYENGFFDLFKKYVNSNAVVNKTESIPKILADEFWATADLSRYFNNHGCCYVISNETDADFTGNNEYLLVTESDSKRVIKTGSSQNILFPEIGEGRQDNMTCQSQTIEINPAHVNRMDILGCCDYNDFSLNISLIYEDGKEELLLSLSNFWNERPVFSEIIVLGVKKVNKTASAAAADDRIYHIYLNTLKIDSNRKLVAIKFPDCPHMHIFAVSYGYVS